MFGDLDLYKEERFFRENQTGKLILPDRIYKLEIFASLIVPSSEDSIFTPDRWRGGIDDLIKFTMKAPLYLNKDTIDRIMTSASEETQILALTTCLLYTSEKHCCIL